ncbi:MAG: adenylosuccinate synthase [Candidatus Ozemobacteraceae bacterium]
MSSSIVLGAQWGDEGKGKIVDLLAEKADVVVRFQGGANAGHTLVVEGRKIVLHQIPSGILHKPCTNLIGPGCVIDPTALLEEIADLRKAGIEVTPEKLKISDRAHIVTPFHRFLDRRQGGAIGTTGRGIGPCYGDKIARTGIRMDSVLHGTVKVTYENYLSLVMTDTTFGDQTDAFNRENSAFLASLDSVIPFIGDTQTMLFAAYKQGARILLEGAQGTLLDIDHGTYPFVTSSNTSIGGALTGTGVYLPMETRIGVAKAYTTRVGNGPFPTEWSEEFADQIRVVGREFGATTGRPRRCGRLDIPLLQNACMVNGFTSLALTKLDCLSGQTTIEVAVGRDSSGNPTYKTLDGWQEDITSAKDFDELPAACRAYVEFIEKELATPISIVSVGPNRSQTLFRGEAKGVVS